MWMVFVCSDNLGGDGDDDDVAGGEREEPIWRSGSASSSGVWRLENATRMNNAELASCIKYFELTLSSSQ